MNKRPTCPILAIIIPLFYWIYLACIAQMIIVNDSLAYERLGRMILNDGWVAFFQNGPNREPLYPLIVSMAMGLSKVLPISYPSILMAMQLGALLLTQLLMWQILKRLQLKPIISFVTLLYVGFSPSLINAAFSLYSEIIVPPIVLAMILLTSCAWSNIEIVSLKRAAGIGALMGAMFILLISTKALFIYIVPLFITPFLLKIFQALRSKNKQFLINALVLPLTCLCITFSFIHTYQLLNQRYNGTYTFTYRGELMLYGITKIRTGDVDAKRYKDGSFYPQLALSQELEYLAFQKKQELMQGGMTGFQADKEFVRLSKKMILKRPFQYGQFYAIQAFMMFFWETTRNGFVIYPRWLTQLYASGILEQVVNFGMAMLTLIAFIFAFFNIRKQLTGMMASHQVAQEQNALKFFTFLLCLLFIGFYSLVLVLPRYLIQIGPLFTILSAVMINSLLKGKTLAV